MCDANFFFCLPYFSITKVAANTSVIFIFHNWLGAFDSSLPLTPIAYSLGRHNAAHGGQAKY